MAVGLSCIGLGTFGWALLSGHPQAAWRAYLVNFLLFSGIAQGAVLFSAMMNTAHAKWSRRYASLAESFAAFFPVSFVLFLLLPAGREFVFPWIGHDLHGKETWLNLPFLFSRNAAGLLLLYGFGFAYLYQVLCLKTAHLSEMRRTSSPLFRWLSAREAPAETREHRKYVFGVLYLLAFAFILSLIGYDLVMAADPHWYSTLFGAYSFVKAIYVGFGALIILGAYLHMHEKIAFQLTPGEFLDMGKLFFAFCLVWADFFYCQFVVIWYGNISEETAYVIERTVMTPWKWVAWTVFGVCFIIPFLILINRKIKTVPKAMLALCCLVIGGMWLEHYLLLGPALSHHAALPVTVIDVLVAGGFGGLLIYAVTAFLNYFPEMLADPVTNRAGGDAR